MLEMETAAWYTESNSWTYTLIMKFVFDYNIQRKYTFSKTQVIRFLSFATSGNTQMK